MLGSLILAVFLSSLDTTVVTTALPTIAGEFNAFESFAWVGTAYIATSTIATPLLGKLSDSIAWALERRLLRWHPKYQNV